jgi:ribonuclease BN (tRNA processing enzyme)
MRLRADGHGEVRVVGPPGTARAVASLRHIVSWRHPRLFVDEVDGGGESGPAYADDVVEVVALGGDGRRWSRPAWLGGGSKKANGAAPATPPPPDYELFPPDSSNPVYARGGGGGGGSSPPPPPPSTLWGWLVWVRPARTALLVVDCATPAAFEGAARHPFNEVATSSSLAAIIHLTPAPLASTPAYAAWVAGLGGGGTRASCPRVLAGAHPPSHPASAWIGHASSARTLARLSAVDAAVFPDRRGGGDRDSGPPLSLPSGLTPGRLLLRVRGGGTAGPPTLDETDCPPPFDAGSVRAEATAQLEKLGIAVGGGVSLAPAPPPAKRARAAAATNQSAAAALRARLSGASPPEPPPPPSNSHPPPTLIFLGTGCAEPSAHRGASAAWLQPSPPGGPGLLLDAGEGTAGALARAAGNAGTLPPLAAIWVSHRHADHCLGVAGVLAAAVGEEEEGGCAHQHHPLAIIGPHAVRRWLADLVAAGAVRPGSYTFTHAASPPPPHVLTSLRLAAWVDTPAIHCADSHALTLDGAAGWRLAVSGDSIPSPAFEAAAKGADLLVHEATFGVGREGDAAAKKHATVAGALGLARRAAAARTLLTHFSARYPAGVPPDAEADPDGWEGAGAAGAVDGMVVPLGGEVWERLPAVGRAAVAALVGLRSRGDGGGDGGGGQDTDGESAGWDSS